MDKDATGEWDPELHRRVGELGASIGETVRDGTSALYAPLHPRELSHEVRRDVAYGPEPLQCFDLHLPPAGGSGLAVLCYVHGGAFVGGDKSRPGSPFYDNIGRFAAESGMIGVNLNYRLAPAVTYPGGAEDVAAALAFVDRHIAEYGGDPAWVVVMGHSAGAAHVATTIARPELRRGAAHAPSGAILSSGIYEPSLGEGGFSAYYGSAPEALSAASAIPGLSASAIPLLVSVAEFDPPQIQLQARRLVDGYAEAFGHLPDLVQADGHNHFSVVMHLATTEGWFGERLARFVAKVAPQPS